MMENDMEKKMENEKETATTRRLIGLGLGH